MGRMQKSVNKEKENICQLETVLFLFPFPFCKRASLFTEVLIPAPLDCCPSNELQSLGLLNK